MTSVSVPDGQASVKVSIVDTGARISGPMSLFMDPPLLDHMTKPSAPSLVFLIEHEKSGRRVVYDLGIRKEVEGYAPAMIGNIKGFTIEPGPDVYEFLRDGGISLDSIEAVIWSHHHVDHVGNPAGFASTTDLVVGPGFKETKLPGYPENPEADILEADYKGRNLRQLNFDEESNGLRIGGFRAFDWFGDGSFYLLETPGHTIDHLAGLARTSVSPSRFIFMGGDLGHHASQWRPSQFLSLPKELVPSPFGPESSFNIRKNVCPCAHFTAHVGLTGSDNEPFAKISGGHPYDLDQARDALKATEAFDADDNIMVIMAHDWTLLPILDLWPKTANGWFEAEWKERGRWTFLKDLVKDVGN